MEAHEMQSLFEAYENVYAQQNLTEETVEELTEEVEIAAQYFYEMGLNEEGVDILIKELGVEEFAEFVYDIAEEYVLTEARAGGARIEPVTAKGQKFKSGKPTGKSLERLRAQKTARRDAEEKSSASKPSGMKSSLQRQSAVAAAAKKQPKKPGVLDRVAGAINRGIERHNAAMSAARETGKVIGKAARGAGQVAREVGRGASGATRLAGHVARKGLNNEYIMGYLIDEGYAETEESAYAILENMGEEWKQTILEMGENIGREPKTVPGRERPAPAGETYAQRQQRMKPKPKVAEGNFLEKEMIDEEESDRMRDRQLERGGMGARASTSPARTGTSKPVDPEKHAETSKKAVGLVRQQIMAKYGKGALM